jgi:outer membrane protein OmpA-like peptidoglycan-associated protein
MKKRLQSLLILSICCFISHSTHAQNNAHNWGVELNAGYMEYQGDLGSALFFAQQPNYQGLGLSVGRYLNPTFDALVNIGIGDVGYYGKTDWLPAPEKFNGFRARIINAQAGLRIKLANDIIISSDALVQPYFIAAFGGVNIYSKIVNIDQYYTEPLNSITSGGGGVNLNFSENFSMRIQTMFNYTFNDVFDGFPWSNGVHKRYKNSDAFMYHSVGLVYHFGVGSGGGSGIKKLKDSDNDGVPNKYDKCKKTPEGAIVDTLGCRKDTDKDGIYDDEDKCPNLAGIEQFNGCPDTDGDGIQDTEDKCPNKAGTAEGKGCPDTDGDGVYDWEDKCPEVKGLVSRQGCPRPDSDKDGVFDDEDKCPTIAGSKDHEGCPDTDGDGVFDNIDVCKTTKGPATNKGCPEIKEEVKKQIALAAKGIYFETASDKIKESSYTNLDKLVKLLNEYPDAKVAIEGHTDSDGEEAANLTLSQKRADAVKAYLASHGVAESRMTATGYGESKPLYDNNTRAGKAKNRRVYFQLVY